MSTHRKLRLSSRVFSSLRNTAVSDAASAANAAPAAAKKIIVVKTKRNHLEMSRFIVSPVVRSTEIEEDM